MDILAHLQEKGVITEAVAAAATKRISEDGVAAEEALREEGVDAELLTKEFAAYFDIPVFQVTESFTVDEKLLGYISEESAIHNKIIPLKEQDGMLVIGVSNPEDLQAREILNFISDKYDLPYKLMYLNSEDMEKALKVYENLSGEVDEALTSLETELDEEIQTKQSEQAGKKQESTEHLKEDAPVTKIVATILRYAVDGGASDIHVEPTDKIVRVRFRVDGILSTSLELPKNVQSAVVARVKILSSMRLDEKRKPQDGRFSATFDGRRIDFRVSVLPTNHGEKIVMRILDNARGVSTLEDTGISSHILDIVRRAVNEPYGIILISGPTGSGKSTTLYTMLGEVDKVSKNVLSLEDPVEYNIDGVSQSQVRPEIGYTFANGLRSALRQDPDVILVGEIRDKETAQLAIQAALTGHLVLSTIHTNNSIGVIPRLIDMGVDPYLIAPTLKLALAQRLARRICPGTGIEKKVEGSMKVMVQEEFKTLPEKYRTRLPENDTVLFKEPSPGCATGTKGRVAVCEALEINEEIERIILNEGSEQEIYKVARSHGFISLKEDAIIKSLKHEIPYEEVSMFGTKIGEENVLDPNEELMTDVDNPENSSAPQV